MKADCRIIAATNKDLDAAIRAGEFREDLYYRLAVVNIVVPPLRERKDDIMPLSLHFTAHYGRVYGKGTLSVSPEVKSVLMRHSWPGNVRELKNFVERAVIFAHAGSIEMPDIPEQYRDFAGQTEQADLHDRYETAARSVILEALSLANGVRQDAAKLLRIDRKTLYNQMKKLKLK